MKSAAAGPSLGAIATENGQNDGHIAEPSGQFVSPEAWRGRLITRVFQDPSRFKIWVCFKRVKRAVGQ